MIVLPVGYTKDEKAQVLNGDVKHRKILRWYFQRGKVLTRGR